MAKKIMQSILIYVSIMVLFVVLSSYNKWEIGQIGYYLWTFMSEMFAAVLTFVAICIFKMNRQVGLHKQGFVLGLKTGWLMIIYSIAYFILNLVSYGPANLIFPNLMNVFLLALSMISVAVFEELMFRGFLLNVFINNVQSTRKNLLLCVLASSAIFGCGHFINLLVRPALLLLTICQAIYTIFAGVFFAAVYLKSKSLYAVIFYHALFDIVTTVFYEILSPEVISNLNVHYASGIDQALGQGLFYVVAAIPLLICGLCILKKVDMQRLVISGTKCE